MNRRESLKSLLVGSIGGGLLINGCSPEKAEATLVERAKSGGYGRTPKEAARDQKLFQEEFLTVPELEMIAVLCDLILPASNTAGSATDAGVPEFIDFIVKDMPAHKLPLRGGLMWLNNRSNKLYNTSFLSSKEAQKRALLDEIAFPEKAQPELAPGVMFFSLLRNLTLTGYYTTKMGIEELGYKGNTPNVWDGVPEEVLREHDVDYDEEWLAKCVDQSKRGEIAQWDEEGNLI